jgi:hypothetical protein
MKPGLLFLSGITCIVFFSCNKADKSFNFHYDYFPLKEGTFVEYKVTRIHHDAGHHDTLVYFLKTMIGDTVTDNEDRPARKFYRYMFNPGTGKYEISDLWTVVLDQNRIESVEENQRMIKLIFSPTRYKEWDRNAFNDFKEVRHYYDKIHEPLIVNGLTFDSTLTVEEDTGPAGVFHHSRKFDVYAKHVGLVRKHYQDYSISPQDPDSKPITGEELFYELVDYGN